MTYKKQSTEVQCTWLEVYYCKKQLSFYYISALSSLSVIRLKNVCIKFFESAKSSKLIKKCKIAVVFANLKANNHYAKARKWIGNPILTFVISHNTMYIMVIQGMAF